MPPPQAQHEPEIVCAECLVVGDHRGHTSHEVLQAVEGRLRGDLAATALARTAARLLDACDHAAARHADADTVAAVCAGVVAVLLSTCHTNILSTCDSKSQRSCITGMGSLELGTPHSW
eukprot:TRINITY_DN767_c0_g2_i1.p4 TRINITY_DN767_c0_g2~~TRINITY_DN767_c0_g2_i1.p4  ORF type:complete len:119 (+),score=31.03 TRINITY_DN767_c0_g2_i1:484-840(+)